MNYRPIIWSHERADGETSVRMYKLVRVQRPDGTFTSCSFDWTAVQAKQRKLGLAPKAFGSLVRDVYRTLHASGALAAGVASRLVFDALESHLLAKQAIIAKQPSQAVHAKIASQVLNAKYLS